jgi:LmbE family N-acetylglucosaminyl deacetylase
MRTPLFVLLVILAAQTPESLGAQGPPRTLVAVLAHADDEDPVGPILARYAREGVQVYLLIATDGSRGTGFAAARGDSMAAGQDLASVRATEAACAAHALGVKPPILLSFPDGSLGDYVGDRSLAYRLTQRIAEELERLRPDVILTWGPEGGTGHPDHRMISSIVTQLQRANAPGVPDRVFYMYMNQEGMRAMNPQRGEPPLLVPDARYLTARVAYSPADFEAATRSITCHASQFTPDAVERVRAATARAWNGAISLIPAFSTPPLTDLFSSR